MNFKELKLKIKSRLSNINFSDWISNFLLKKNQIFMVTLSLVILSFYAYFWYNYIYYPGWSDNRKQEYIESKKEESVVLNKNKLNKVMAEIENRKNNFRKSVENIPDIFSIK